MNKDKIIDRLDRMIGIGNNCMNNYQGIENRYVTEDLFYPFRAGVYEVAGLIKGKESKFYKDLVYQFIRSSEHQMKLAMNYLHHLKTDVEFGYVDNLESLISGEIYTDFLDMAESLLAENYPDAAAVMAGGVLEGQLKKLCIANNISLTDEKDEKIRTKGADWLNKDLLKNKIYEKSEHNLIKVLIDIRNDAAHTDRPIVEKTRVEGMIVNIKLLLSRYASSQ